MIDERQILDLFTRLVTGMCEHRCRVSMQHPSLENNLSFHTITFIPESGDYGKVCGKNGKVINALKFLAKQSGIVLKLEDSFEGQRSDKSPFKQNPEFDEGAAVDFVIDMCEAFLGKKVNTSSARDVDKLHVTVLDPKEHDLPIIKALSDVLFQWSWQQGFLLQLRPEKRKAVA